MKMREAARGSDDWAVGKGGEGRERMVWGGCEFLMVLVLVGLQGAKG